MKKEEWRVEEVEGLNRREGTVNYVIVSLWVVACV